MIRSTAVPCRQPVPDALARRRRVQGRLRIVWYGQDVEAPKSGGPDQDAIVQYILERHPDTIIATAMGATFFSCDESSWPNFATLVTTDEHDTSPVSNLARPGVFRLNISLSRERFAQLVGGQRDPDFAALDTLMPHPVYAAQHWACILNPSTVTFDRVIKPLLDEAHERVARAAKAKKRKPD